MTCNLGFMGNATVPGTVGAHYPRLTPARAFLANQAARDTSKSADLAAFAESVSTSHQASSACARANPERSSSMSSIGGTASSLQSKRPRCAAGQRGGDAELQQAWRILGKPGGYDAPGEQELQDLADSRNRKRGEREQKRRLKANWQALERVAAAQPAEPEPTGPAVPHARARHSAARFVQRPDVHRRQGAACALSPVRRSAGAAARDAASSFMIGVLPSYGSWPFAAGARLARRSASTCRRPFGSGG